MLYVYGKEELASTKPNFRFDPFPTAPFGRVQYAMAMAHKILLSLPTPPSKKSPICLNNYSSLELQFLWTALRYFGIHMRTPFNSDAIVVPEIYHEWIKTQKAFFSHFSSDSLFETEFKQYLTPYSFRLHQLYEDISSEGSIKEQQALKKQSLNTCHEKEQAQKQRYETQLAQAAQNITPNQQNILQLIRDNRITKLTFSETKRTVTLHQTEVFTILPYGRIATASQNNIVIWDIISGERLQQLDGNFKGLNHLTLLAGGRLTLGTNDGVLHTWCYPLQQYWQRRLGDAESEEIKKDSPKKSQFTLPDGVTIKVNADTLCISYLDALPTFYPHILEALKCNTSLLSIEGYRPDRNNRHLESILSLINCNQQLAKTLCDLRSALREDTLETLFFLMSAPPSRMYSPMYLVGARHQIQDRQPGTIFWEPHLTKRWPNKQQFAILFDCLLKELKESHNTSFRSIVNAEIAFTPEQCQLLAPFLKKNQILYQQKQEAIEKQRIEARLAQEAIEKQKIEERLAQEAIEKQKQAEKIQKNEERQKQVRRQVSVYTGWAGSNQNSAFLGGGRQAQPAEDARKQHEEKLEMERRQEEDARKQREARLAAERWQREADERYAEMAREREEHQKQLAEERAKEEKIESIERELTYGDLSDFGRDRLMRELHEVKYGKETCCIM